MSIFLLLCLSLFYRLSYQTQECQRESLSSPTAEFESCVMNHSSSETYGRLLCFHSICIWGEKCNKYSFYILAFYQYMEVHKSCQNKTLRFDPCSLEEYCLVVNRIFFLTFISERQFLLGFNCGIIMFLSYNYIVLTSLLCKFYDCCILLFLEQRAGVLARLC